MSEKPPLEFNTEGLGPCDECRDDAAIDLEDGRRLCGEHWADAIADEIENLGEDQ